LQRLAQIITLERTQWIVEADIKGFFNNVCHDHLLRFVQQRVSDAGVLRIIGRFLRAGFLEDGVIQASEQGTPQGGLVSPVLANIYLHYVLDLWFEKRYAKGCQGKAYRKRQPKAVLNQSLICARTALIASRSKACGSKAPPHHSSMASCSS
jgi:RNA-directed DNA polymerase